MRSGDLAAVGVCGRGGESEDGDGGTGGREGTWIAHVFLRGRRPGSRPRSIGEKAPPATTVGCGAPARMSAMVRPGEAVPRARTA
ncbi:hypothetical protein GCM10009535_30200 [Streptomyces thermocarboxydovorans]|uniref:Uncharacterized protein n=1 Tax=Streptomyces thermocarboxydovorans TaxID=59298 RepID=A0ABN1HHP5_9ACTN